LGDAGRDRHRRLTLIAPTVATTATTTPSSATVSPSLAREGSIDICSIPSAGIPAVTTATAGSGTAGEQHEDSNEESGLRASHESRYVQYRYKGQ
jgi:hypothetical protein